MVVELIDALIFQATMCPALAGPQAPIFDGAWPPVAGVSTGTGIAYHWVRLGLTIACLSLVIGALRVRHARKLALWYSAGALACALAWNAILVLEYVQRGNGSISPNAASANMAMASGFFGVYVALACVPLLAALILFALRVRVVIPTVALAVALAPLSYVLIGWSIAIYRFTCGW